MICQPTRIAYKKMHVDIEVYGYRFCVTDMRLLSFSKGQDASTTRQTPARKCYWNTFSRDSLHSQGQGNIVSGSKYFPIGRKFFCLLCLNVYRIWQFKLKALEEYFSGEICPSFQVHSATKSQKPTGCPHRSRQWARLCYSLRTFGIFFFLFGKLKAHQVWS